jgi:hypothetical protein
MADYCLEHRKYDGCKDALIEDLEGALQLIRVRCIGGIAGAWMTSYHDGLVHILTAVEQALKKVKAGRDPSQGEGHTPEGGENEQTEKSRENQSRTGKPGSRTAARFYRGGSGSG